MTVNYWQETLISRGAGAVSSGGWLNSRRPNCQSRGGRDHTVIRPDGQSAWAVGLFGHLPV